VQHLRRPLRLAPITLKTFMRLQATALSGFGLLFGAPFKFQLTVPRKPPVVVGC